MSTFNSVILLHISTLLLKVSCFLSHLRPHCERALCCRLEPSCGRRFQALDDKAFRLHHPSLFGTAVKLDTGVISTDDSTASGANFQNSLCYVWAGFDECMEIIDGRSGLLQSHIAMESEHTQQGCLSSVSKQLLFQKWLAVLETKSIYLHQNYDILRDITYRNAKGRAISYQVTYACSSPSL